MAANKAREPHDDALFNALVATAVDGIMIIDADGLLQVYSDACERMFGYRRDEVIGRNVKMLMPSPYHAEHDGYLSRYRQTGERHIIGSGREVFGRRKNGTTFPMYLSVGQGEMDGRRIFIGIVHDISEQKRSMDDARRLAAIVESSDDAIIGKDLNDIITSWNKGAERLFGYAPEDIIGLPVTTLIPPDRHDEESDIAERMRRGDRIEHYETLRRHRDGRPIEISLSVSPTRDAGGEITGASKIARDITGRKADAHRVSQLQNELLHATRLASTGQLGAALAHELNQPLTAILNYTGVLQELGAHLAGADGELLRDVVRRVAEQTERAGEIIRRLRGFVAKREPERRMQPLNDAIGEAIALSLIGTIDGGVRLKSEFAAALPAVLIDKVQIQQVMINLLRNAVEAMRDSAERTLTVTTARDGETFVRVSIADTGSGIAPEVAAMLFQPFVTTKGDGLGIGLSICRTIIESHGGRLWTQANEGSGTVFHFRLPLAPDEAGTRGR